MRKLFLLPLVLIGTSLPCQLFAQNTPENPKTMTELPYYQIPDAPTAYTGENTIARMIDGLGFRYYWATEGLRQEDLDYKPSEDARTSNETLDHIYSLTSLIVNTVKNKPNVSPAPETNFSFEEKRRRTLENIKMASDILKTAKAGSLSDYKMIFETPKGTSDYPVWNLINGPISDALWHVGQVVSFRRGSGNPFNSKASVLVGKVRE